MLFFCCFFLGVTKQLVHACNVLVASFQSATTYNWLICVLFWKEVQYEMSPIMLSVIFYLSILPIIPIM